MKKLTFCLMALAMAASTVFTSCGDDDDDDNNNPINSLSASVKDGAFSTSAAAFYQSAKNANNTGANESVFKNIFGSDNSTATTTIAGLEKGKQLAINVKGTTSGTYRLSVSTDNAINNALIDLLSGKTVKETISDAASNVVKTDAMIIYRSAGEAEGGATYYFSTEATVNVNFDLAVYSTGTFTATMRNTAGDTFQITDGKFSVFGKPSLGN
ncbi:MAG: hypothetical protein J6T96_15760 [Bacteroidales bacterium]|nr:hypothetical protein [Bacteroidales bacterium]